MISGLFTTIQQDVQCISNHLSKQGIQDDDQNHKVNMAALRMFAVLGMAFAVMTGLGIFTAATIGAVLFKLTTAVAIYVLCHDIFIMAKNSEKDAVNQFVAVGQGLIADLQDIFNGKKDLNDVPRHVLAQGTILRPVWDNILR